MKELLHNRRLATAAVFLGLGGLGMAGCGNDSEKTAKLMSNFDICPTRDLIPTNPGAQARAKVMAQNLACFALLREYESPPQRTEQISLRNNVPGRRGEAHFQVSRSTDSLLADNKATYTLRVTGSSLPELRGALIDVGPDESAQGIVNAGDMLTSGIIDSASVEVESGSNTLFAYELSEQANGWHLKSEVLDKGGASHRFNERINSSTWSHVLTLSHVASQAACFEEHAIPPSYFQPQAVGHHPLLQNCEIPELTTSVGSNK